MNRRDFLKSLAAIGAAFTIPFEALATVPEAIIDDVWKEALDTPMTLYVRSQGSISVRPGCEPLHLYDEDDEDEYSDKDTGQQQALEFFRDDFEHNELFGISIVEGCCPWREYYAAELEAALPSQMKWPISTAFRSVSNGPGSDHVQS